MREEKSNGMFLPVLFGAMGLIVLMLAWLWPVLAADRIPAILVGSASVIGALLRIPAARRSANRSDDKEVTVKVDIKENK